MNIQEGLDANIADLEKQIEEANQKTLEADLETTPEPEDIVEETLEEVLEEDPQEDVEEDNLPEDAPKEGKKWAQMRNELKEAKEAREQAVREAQEVKERMARIEGMMESQERFSQSIKEVTQEPDKELEPEAWAEFQIQQLRKENEEFKKIQKVTNEQMVYQQELRGKDIIEKSFESQNPEFKEARDFLRNQEKLRIKTLYPQATDDQIMSHLDAEEMNIYRNNTHAAPSMIMNLAKASGFSKEVKEAPAKPNLEKISKNKKKSGSLIGTSAAASGGISAEQIVNMTASEMMGLSESDFNKAIQELENRG